MKKMFIILFTLISMALVENISLAVECEEGGECIGGVPSVEYYDPSGHKLGTRCTKCQKLLNTLTLVSHSFPSNYTTDATYHRKKCRDCSYEEANKHTMKYVTTKQPTCTSPGERKYTCSTCGYGYTSEVAKTDHTWGTKYTSKGEFGCYNKCTVCGTSNTATAHVIPVALGWFEYYDNAQHYHSCQRCGYFTGYEAHSYVYEVIEEATCTDAGARNVSCEYCAYTYEETISAKGHSWGNYAANGDSGHRKKCSVCGVYTETEEHIYSDEWTPTITSPSYSHCHRCTVCSYESDIQVHNIVVKWTGEIDGIQYHKLGCSLCSYEETEERCTHNSAITKEANCTEEGNRRYTCIVCKQYYDEAISILEHVYSDWETTQTEHWKACTYGCGTKILVGNHIDKSPVNGRCDDCNYLMHIAPVATISSDVTVKEGEAATFKINLTEGTEPLTYQWYYKTSATGAGNIVSGGTADSLTLTTTRNMDGNLYYCVISNPLSSFTTDTAELTVYYPFTITTTPQELNLKKDEEGTVNVSIGTSGNPSTYTYQWYMAKSQSGAGTKISGATSSSYKIKPTKNVHAEYYYCVVNNTQYEITSNRCKLTADITLPEISMGTFNQNVIINKNATLKIPFTVKDTGEGYTEDNNNFTASDIKVLIGGVNSNEVTKSLKYNGSTGDENVYELTITNLTGNGKLSFNIPAGAVKDNFENQNTSKTFDTNVTVDNIAPVITFESVTGDLNGKYANKEDTLLIKLAVTEAIGFEKTEFTVDDIIIKVAGTTANSTVERILAYKEKIGNKYIYELTLKNVEGNGELSLEIGDAKMKDLALNPNGYTNLFVEVSSERVIIDNTKPVINSLITTLGGYNTSREYPVSIAANHDNWANEDVYVQINATDNTEIDYYMKSIGSKFNYEKMESNQEKISDSIENYIYYRVMDKAGNYEDRIVDASGNYVEASKLIKIDKVTPNKPVISLFEQRQNGAYYEFDEKIPSDKSIYVIPDASTIVDAGNVKSGIEKNEQYTYYTINSYTNLDKTETLNAPLKFSWDEGFLLDEFGYYEITMTMTDIAGNQVESDIYKVYIDKKAENTIKISNINDIGSGIKTVTIKIYKSDAVGNITTNEAIEPIIIDNPYKEIIRNVRLGEGKFYIEVDLEDNVGLITTLKKTIVNDL